MTPPIKAPSFGRSANCFRHHFALSGWKFASLLGREGGTDCIWMISECLANLFLPNLLWFFPGNFQSLLRAGWLQYAEPLSGEYAELINLAAWPPQSMGLIGHGPVLYVFSPLSYSIPKSDAWPYVAILSKQYGRNFSTLKGFNLNEEFIF